MQMTADPTTTVTAIPNHARVSLNLSKLTYTERTLNAVADILKRHHADALNAAGYRYLNGATLETHIDISVEGASLAKRVGSWLYQNADKTKLDRDAAMLIGELAADAKGFTCEVDLTDTFDWTDGDFGDRGSCFFQGRDYARARCHTLPRLHASALRFWRNGAGLGRCFVVPLPRRLVDANDAYLLTNYYGKNVTPQRAALVCIHLLTDTFGGAWTHTPIHVTTGSDMYMYWNPLQQVVIHRPDFTPPTSLTLRDCDVDYKLPLPQWAIEGLNEWEDNNGDDDYYNDNNDDDPWGV